MIDWECVGVREFVGQRDEMPLILEHLIVMRSILQDQSVRERVAYRDPKHLKGESPNVRIYWNEGIVCAPNFKKAFVWNISGITKHGEDDGFCNQPELVDRPKLATEVTK